MRILIHVSLPTMLRHFESVLVSLADRGHSVRIAYHRAPELPLPTALASHERIAFARSPGRRGDDWSEQIVELRAVRDYLRYLDKRFAGAPKLRARALRKMVQAATEEERLHLIAPCPRCGTRLVDDEIGGILRAAFRKKGIARISRLLAHMEATIPSSTVIEAFLREQQPDVVLVTPLIALGSYQPDFVKSARALDIPVVFPVFSWDNLSTKGLIHVQPDQVFVWNEWQRAEAVEMHGVPDERVVVTGAPRFDEFFAMQPETTRDAFCEAHGFDPRQPIVTYLCSSEFVAAEEVQFVTRWIGEVRRAPRLAACNILVRPHPRQKTQWKQFAAPAARVAVSRPRAINADQTLFDTLHHSAAAVGLNTSAQLEAAIAGRPVLTILAPEFAAGQQGTIHFGTFSRSRADSSTSRPISTRTCGSSRARWTATTTGTASAGSSAASSARLVSSGRQRPSWWRRSKRSRDRTRHTRASSSTRHDQHVPRQETLSLQPDSHHPDCGQGAARGAKRSRSPAAVDLEASRAAGTDGQATV